MGINARREMPSTHFIAAAVGTKFLMICRIIGRIGNAVTFNEAQWSYELIVFNGIR